MKLIIISLIILGILFLTNYNTVSFSKKSLYCCNDDDPRQLPHGTYFSYFCYNGEVLQEIEISYNCCWDEWAANGWQPPTYRPCPNPNLCLGPPPD